MSDNQDKRTQDKNPSQNEPGAQGKGQDQDREQHQDKSRNRDEDKQGR